MPTVTALPHPTETALSFVTPPEETRKTLEEANKLGIRRVWLQHNSYNEEDLKYARASFETAVGGSKGANADHGWCVLVHGETAMRESGTYKL